MKLLRRLFFTTLGISIFLIILSFIFLSSGGPSSHTSQTPSIYWTFFNGKYIPMTIFNDIQKELSKSPDTKETKETVYKVIEKTTPHEEEEEKVLKKEYTEDEAAQRVNNVLMNGKSILDSPEGEGTVYIPTKEYLNSRKYKPTYSKFRFHHMNIPSEATWLLNNVCMDGKGQFLFYTNERLNKNWLHKINGGTLAFLQSNLDSKSLRKGFDIKVVPTEIPLDKVPRWIEKTVIPFKRFAVGNVGHAFADNLLPILELMAQYDLNSDETLLLMMDEIFYRENICVKNSDGVCPEFASSYHYDKQKSVKYSLEWTQMFTPLPILQMCTYEGFINSTSIGMIGRMEQAPCPLDDVINKDRLKSLTLTGAENEELTNSIQVCFKQLAFGIGGRSWIVSPSTMRDSIITLFRKQMFRNMGIKPKNDIHDGDTITVAIHNKPVQGRHGNVISNRAEIAEYLRTYLRDEPIVRELNKTVNIIEIKLEDFTSIEQLKFFSQVDVYISTIGSGSFYSLFMPDDSSLLYAPECAFVSRREARRLGVTTRWVCRQPIIHFHSSLPHINVFDLTSKVRDCAFRFGGDRQFLHPDTMDRCDPVLDTQLMLAEVSKAIEMRAVRR